MRTTSPATGVVVCALLVGAASARGQDWPQWRGPTRDNKVVGFTVPTAWPKELTKKWQVDVGIGDASPALVGDKLYVFTRREGDEVVLCLDAGTGKEIWQSKYATPAANPPQGYHKGPRSAPAVGEGKVCTLGVNGKVRCLDAAKGTVAWEKDTNGKPRFWIASSPLILEGKCIVQVGGPGTGTLMAFDLASGAEKWKLPGDGPGYGSPVVMTVAGTKQVIALTEKGLVGAAAEDGKLLWQAAFVSQYNSCTPIVDGEMVIVSGPPRGGEGGGTVAYKVEKDGSGFKATETWKKPKYAGTYNTPVLKDGMLYGLGPAGGGGGGGGGMRGGGAGNFFCMNAKTGEVVWTDETKRGDCGEILDAGAVLLALSNDGFLVAFKPGDKKPEELAKYKVSDGTGNDGPWAYPIISGKRVFVKDKDKMTLWTID